MTTFAELNLAPEILKALDEAGYSVPTPIQAQAIPVVLNGKDLMAGAQTGTGKTAAFVLPTLQQLLSHASGSTSPARHPVRALILTPTRELAVQVEESVQAYSKYCQLKSVVLYGGVDIKQQIPILRKGIEIVVATPGRLLDLLEMKALTCHHVQMLVLDEADRMLDMGFLPDLKKILSYLPAKRQNLLFSATFSNEIKKLSADFLTHPELIEVARSNATSENILQQVYLVESESKRAALLSILKEKKITQVIVFTRTKVAASQLLHYLQREQVPADAIHGDKSQRERIQALEAFKQGSINVLIGTDVAARGIDIDQLPMVINYEMPTTPEDYVHRIGRTGRAGAKGEAISLVASDEKRMLAEIEKLIKRELPKIQWQQPNNERVRGAHAHNYVERKRNHKSNDDWFNRPYESGSSQSKLNRISAPDHEHKPKKQVAALLRRRDLTIK